MPWQSELIVLIPDGHSTSSKVKKKSFYRTCPLVITEPEVFKMYFGNNVENFP